MTAKIEYERAKAEFRLVAINGLTEAFKKSSGYSAMDHGIDHWRETATILVDTIREMTEQTKQDIVYGVDGQIPGAER